MKGDTATRRALIALEGFTALGAIIGAIGLIVDGDGFMGHTVDIDDIPMHSWPLAGVVLLVLNGFVPAVALTAEVRRHQRADMLHGLVGVTLMVWIAVQVAFIGLVFALQPLMFLVGAAILGLAARRRGRRS